MAAVFAPDDIQIIKNALTHYIRMANHGCVSDEEMAKLLSLYHRLGRLVNEESRT